MDWLWKALRRTKSVLLPSQTSFPTQAPEPIPSRDRQAELFPDTFHQFPHDNRAEHQRHFDPALLHLPNAFRNGDAVVYDGGSQAQWYAAQRHVIDRVIRTVSKSPWADNLVLRGSLLLESWFPNLARRPGDIDWAIAPETINCDGLWAEAFFRDFPAILTRQPADRGVEIVAANITSDEIWTYDRAPGTRLAVPWRHPSLPPGVVQLDFVFSERLLTGPIRVSIAMSDGTRIPVWAATMEESLAWKLVWLENDIHPQGKDLYDAVLLAEHCQMPVELLWRTRDALHPDHPAFRDFEFEITAESWQHFQREYSAITGTAAEWTDRLHKALGHLTSAVDDESRRDASQ